MAELLQLNTFIPILIGCHVHMFFKEGKKIIFRGKAELITNFLNLCICVSQKIADDCQLTVGNIGGK